MAENTENTKRRRLDHRGLRALQAMAVENQTAAGEENASYWQGVADVIEHMLGEPVFNVVEEKTITRTLLRK